MAARMGGFFNVRDADSITAMRGIEEMRLKGILESIDDLDESIAGCYTKNEKGLFELDVDLDGTGHKSALDKIKTERNTLRASLKNSEDALAVYKPIMDLEDFDPSTISDLIVKAEAAGDPEAIEKLQRQHEKLLGEANEKVTKAEEDSLKSKSAMKKFIIKGVQKDAAIDGDVRLDNISDVVTLTSNHFDLDENDEVIVVDDEGDPTGKTPKEYYASVYKEQKPQFYNAEGLEGSGARKTTTRGAEKTISRTKWSALDPQTKAAMAKTHTII